MSILIIVGSKSDMHIAEKATKILKENNADYDLEIASAHREPQKVLELIKKKDYMVYICIAGLSAALPGF
ncbi:MAG: AIR carboxylase family protein, partial [Methanomicrobia archaeon]|nr:AIR carboxylase family protein [Methanomicrobia archaeon]